MRYVAERWDVKVYSGVNMCSSVQKLIVNVFNHLTLCILLFVEVKDLLGCRTPKCENVIMPIKCENF